MRRENAQNAKNVCENNEKKSAQWRANMAAAKVTVIDGCENEATKISAINRISNEVWRK